MKRCSRCSQEKEDSEFSFKTKDKKSNYCKLCQREYCKEHYSLNKIKYIKKARILTNKTIIIQRLKLREIKSNNPCTDCGKKYPYYVMQFDHLYDKVYNISNMPGKCSWNKIEAEIKKCQLVCANCHYKRTWERQHNI